MRKKNQFTLVNNVHSLLGPWPPGKPCQNTKKHCILQRRCGFLSWPALEGSDIERWGLLEGTKVTFIFAPSKSKIFSCWSSFNILLAATSLLWWVVVIIPGMVSVWRLAGPSPSLSTPTRSFQSKFPREQTPTTTNPSRGLKRKNVCLGMAFKQKNYHRMSATKWNWTSKSSNCLL